MKELKKKSGWKSRLSILSSSTDISGSDAPLARSLIASAKSERMSWHMPGHSAARGFPRWLEKNLARIDVTELPATDDINLPAGPAKQAMAKAASIFGAAETRFITSGATTAIHIMLACAAGTDKQIIVSRCCHQSIVSAAAVLGLEIIWCCKEGSEHEKETEKRSGEEIFSLLYQPDPENIEACLRENPACKTVLVTSPDYYGFCADLEKISAITRKFGAALLVDEAHGGHFVFDQENLPVSALASGADMCVQSGHKTLPVLTQGAWLHVSRAAVQQGIIDLSILESLIPVFQTSSPSFPIAATLDYAGALMEKSGESLIRRQLLYISNMDHLLDENMLVSPQCMENGGHISHDPVRVIITSKKDNLIFPARELAEKLAAEGWNVEFADLTRIILLPSLFKKKREWYLLARKINRLIRLIEPDRDGRLLSVEKQWRSWLMKKPDLKLPLRESMLSGKKIIMKPADQSEGKILAKMIAPYPPGIPLFLPGELIDVKKLDFLSLLIENDINTAGIEHGKIPVIG